MPDRQWQPRNNSDSRKEEATLTKRPLASEVIRKRVDQLIQNTSLPIHVDQPTLTSIHNSSNPSASAHKNAIAESSYSRPRPLDASVFNFSDPMTELQGQMSMLSFSSHANPDGHEIVLPHLTSTGQPASSSHVSRPSFLHPRSTEGGSQLSSLSRAKSSAFSSKRSSRTQELIYGDIADLIVNPSDRKKASSASISNDAAGLTTLQQFEWLKREIQTLTEALHESKKAAKRFNKKLEECKTELQNAKDTIHDKASELSFIKTKYNKCQETLSVIEASIQCQICMDLPHKPYALAPCGHILCLTCLQEWFRRAPSAIYDFDSDTDEPPDPRDVMMSSKTCPTCRATVKRRPAPVFMVKAVSEALEKASSSPPRLESTFNTSIESENEDPWKGIFPQNVDSDDSEESFGTDEEESDDGIIPTWYPIDDTDENEEDDEDDDDRDEYRMREEDSEDEVPTSWGRPIFIAPRWVPPRATNRAPHMIGGQELPRETLKLLQRGCSLEMLRNYNISYEHNNGIILSLESDYGIEGLEGFDNDSSGEEDTGVKTYRIRLGWNITLGYDDFTGDRYVWDVIQDIKNNPSSWEIIPRHVYPPYQRATEAVRLVRAEDVEDYDTTDTEIWIDAEDS